MKTKWILILLAAVLGALPLLAQVHHPDEIAYPAMPPVDVPEPRRVELDNGLVVILLEDHELPLITGRVLVKTGSRLEDAEKIGLAGVTGLVMRSGGTEKLAADALDDLLEAKAASIETSIGTASGTGFMSCLTEDFDETFELFHDVLRFPAFAEDRLQVAKNQVVTSIARQNDNPGSIANRELTELIYGEGSPYAWNETYETMGNFGRDDLVAWHAKYFHPNRMILGLVGDFNTDEILPKVKKVFGSWPRGGKSDDAAAFYRQEPRPGVFFVEKSDVTQSNLRIGHLGLRRDHPEYFAVELMNQVMSGSFAARLFSRIRSEKGLAYNVGGGMGSNWDYPGLFRMSMSTKTETTVAGVEALIEEARNMTAEPPTETEVERARASILNSFVFRADSTREILNRQMSYEYYGIPLDWLERYRARIEEVTLGEVRAAAQHIRVNDLTILVVGPREGTDKPLSTLGEVTEIDITIPEPAAPEVEVTEAGKQRGLELIAKAVEGLGGADNLAAVKSLRIASKVELTAPQGTMELETNGTVVLPDKLRFEMTLPFGTMARVVNGDTGFLQAPQGTQPLPESQISELKASLVRLPIVLLSLRDAEGFLAVAKGTEEIGGKSVETVHVEVDGHQQTLGIDPETGYIHSVDYRGQSPAGTPGDLRQINSDFRKIDGGLVLPFTSETTIDGEPMVKGTNTVVEINPEVDAVIFEMP